MTDAEFHHLFVLSVVLCFIGEKILRTHSWNWIRIGSRIHIASRTIADGTDFVTPSSSRSLGFLCCPPPTTAHHHTSSHRITHDHRQPHEPNLANYDTTALLGNDWCESLLRDKLKQSRDWPPRNNKVSAHCV